MDAPAVIPLFPLPNVVLFPSVSLPLHIFEPRYREMVRDLEEAEVPLVGMTLMRGPGDAASTDPLPGAEAIHHTGCAGLLLQTEALADGRSNILLRGEREFTIDGEVAGKSYRQARVRWSVAPEDRLDSEARATLIDSVKRTLDEAGRQSVDSVLAGDALSDEALINFFAAALDLTVIEKQALLESRSVCPRATRLAEILEFRVKENSAGGSSGGWLQ